MKKSLYHKKSIYFILLTVLLFIIIFSLFIIFQTKELVGKAFVEYFQERQFTDNNQYIEEQQLDLVGKAYKKSSSAETESSKQKKDKTAASKPGSIDLTNSPYSETEIKNCIASKVCKDKIDGGNNENKKGTILYYDKKTNDCITATDTCKNDQVIIEYHCEKYKETKYKNNIEVFSPTWCPNGCNKIEGRCNTEFEKEFGTCFDKTKNGNEEQIDCGGNCQKCPSCFDNKLNQNELFLDCGGICPVCDEQKVSHCKNKIQDKDELGIDCGGLTCGPCKEDADLIYPDQCKNNKKDFNEIGINCGGPCPPCGYIPPKKTVVPDHCVDKIFDEVTEEQQDCGKECPACKEIPAETCTDGTKNQDETGKDCGGSKCSACINANDCEDSDKALDDGNNLITDKEKGINIYVPGHITENGNSVYDSCVEANNKLLLKEMYCNAAGKISNFFNCDNGCKETAEGAYCLQLELFCEDKDGDAGSLLVEDPVFGKDLYSYDYKYSISSSAVQTDKEGSIIQQKKDSCEDYDTVKEAYCNGDTPEYEYFDCPKEAYGYDIFDGCANGVCCANSNKCIDSDEDKINNGIDIFKKSSATTPQICLSISPSISKFDSCGVSYCTSIGDGIEVEGENPYNCPANTQRKIDHKEGSYGDLVEEYFCDGNEIKSSWFSCAQGQACIEGECKSFTCLDTDINQQKPAELIAGSTTGIGFEKGITVSKTFNDVCVDKNLLKEYRCSNKNVNYPDKNAKLITAKIYAVYDYVYCPGNCLDGKCVSQSSTDIIINPNPPVDNSIYPICADSDNLDFTKKGYVIITNKASSSSKPKENLPLYDECVKGEEKLLKEWTCKTKQGYPVYEVCSSGCKDGACKI